MSTIDDLRTSLDEHASTVQDHALVSRAAEVHRRVRVVRRRRWAGAVAAAAVVVGAAGVVAALPEGEPTITPVDRPAPTDTPSPATPSPARAPEFPQQLGDGAPLAGELVGVPGQADLRFHVRAPHGTLRWSTYCAPRHSGLWYSVTFNGVERMMGQCNSSPDDSGTWWSSFDDLTRADGSPLRPGDRIDVRVRLFQNRHTHTLVSDPRVRLGVGAYVAAFG